MTDPIRTFLQEAQAQDPLITEHRSISEALRSKAIALRMLQEVVDIPQYQFFGVGPYIDASELRAAMQKAMENE